MMTGVCRDPVSLRDIGLIQYVIAYRVGARLERRSTGVGSEREQRMAELVSDTPMRRFGRPEEVAALAVMLASDEATYMTGPELNLDGGLLAGTAVVPARA